MGYPYFLCGLAEATVYEVLLRGEHCNGDDNDDSGAHVHLTVSRSYSAMCQGLESIGKPASLAGPRSDVPPIPAVSHLDFDTSSESSPMPIAIWLLAQAKCQKDIDSTFDDGK